MNIGQRIIAGLQDAVDGNFSAVTIEGQTWVRTDGKPLATACANLTLEVGKLRGQVANLERVIADHHENVYLISVVAKIREVTGVGDKPMLSELSGAIEGRIREFEEALEPFRRYHRYHEETIGPRADDETVALCGKWGTEHEKITFGDLRRASEVLNNGKQSPKNHP